MCDYIEPYWQLMLICRLCSKNAQSNRIEFMCYITLTLTMIGLCWCVCSKCTFCCIPKIRCHLWIVDSCYAPVYLAKLIFSYEKKTGHRHCIAKKSSISPPSHPPNNTITATVTTSRRKKNDSNDNYVKETNWFQTITVCPKWQSSVFKSHFVRVQK